MDINEDDPRYRKPLARDLKKLMRQLPADAQVVLLGSIATGKYIDVLLENFGERLLFPADFVGRGDMSRGGLLLRCAVDGCELSYIPGSRRGPERKTTAKAGAAKIYEVKGLELQPPVPPMEARTQDEIPTGDEWQYEPKWDGFRCIAFRDGGEVYLQSKAGQPLARYFPDVARGVVSSSRCERFVLDGELVIPVGGALVFDELQLRLHPAASRVQKLAAAQSRDDGRVRPARGRERQVAA